MPATFADEQIWYEANRVTGRDMMALGAVVAVVALLLPQLVRLQEHEYGGIFATVLGIGAMLSAVRGWRLANRLLRERRQQGDHR